MFTAPAGQEIGEKKQTSRKGDLICKSLAIDRRFVNRVRGNLHSIQEIPDVYWLKDQPREEYSTIRPLHRISAICIILVSSFLLIRYIISLFPSFLVCHRSLKNSSIGPFFHSDTHCVSNFHAFLQCHLLFWVRPSMPIFLHFIPTMRTCRALHTILFVLLVCL